MTTMIDLTQIQTQYLMKRMPPFELSYETIAHKKVYPSYNLGIAIPSGKKCYAYFSFQQQNDVCYLMEINRDKKITKVSTIDTQFNSELSLGTMVYGTVIQIDEPSMDESVLSNVNAQSFRGRTVFIIEDIFYYKGLSLKNMPFGEKLGYIELMFQYYLKSIFTSPHSTVFALPFLWGIVDSNKDTIIEHFDTIKHSIYYLVHHIQIRKLNEISPYLNIMLTNLVSKIKLNEKMPDKMENSNPVIVPNIDILKYTIQYHKPQYKYPTVFQVSADIQFDIYHLFAYGKNKLPVYYGVAGIFNIETSIFMNGLFRNIKENSNIDYIEESEDESDFENMAEDKFVDLNKTYNIECIFNHKFKKWVPVKVVKEPNRIVHISKLVCDYNW